MENANKKTNEALIQMMRDGEFTLEQVIDSVIEANGIIGVGLISLGDHLRKYTHDKISKK